MKTLLVLAMALVGLTANASGLSQLPVDDAGRMYYGEGKHEGNYNYLGAGKVRIFCNGDFFADEDSFKAYVRGEKKGFITWRQFSSEAGSASCARAKTVVACATKNTLEFCEANVIVKRDY